MIRTTNLPLPVDVTDGTTIFDQEVQAHLPMARTELGMRTLLAQPALWKTLISHAASDPNSVQHQLPKILTDHTLNHLLNPPTVAIIGLANVGKSTLANRLFAQERSITADVPGTTRDWVGEIANIDGLPVLLLDTPGLRQTADPIEATAINRSRDQIVRAHLTLLVFDATRPLAGEQSEIFHAFPDSLVVINKSDQPISPDLTSIPAIRTVATTGLGVCELRAAIFSRFCSGSALPMIWTGRQREIVEQAVKRPGVLEVLFAARQ